ncbi:MAG: hypothetical protein E7504_01505 [Ruminococcus sp.]|nr:hypothetical protein [Ruminococcus sp.]
MKKSFLKRAMAAAIAVPVALTQTLLCVALAEDAPATTTTLTVDTFLSVPTSGDYAKLVSSTDTERVYEQSSMWNVVMFNAVNSMAGKTTVISGSELAESIETGGSFYKTVLKNMVASGNAKVEISKDAKTVAITVDVSYDSSADVSEFLSKELGEDVFVETGVFDGEVVLKINTADLMVSTEVPYDVTIVTTEDGEMDIPGYIQTRMEYLKYSLASVDPAVAAKILKKAEKGVEKFNYLPMVSEEKSYTGANCDDIIAQIKADLKNKDYEGKKYVDKYDVVDEIPDTVAEVLDKSIVTKVLAKAITKVSEASDGEYRLDVTVEDLAAVAESITEVTVSGSLQNGAAEASVSGTMTDNVDVEALRAYFQAKEEKNGFDIVTFDVVKVVDASANGDMDTLSGTASLDIKRVITYTVEEDDEPDTTEPDSTEPDSTEPDSTEPDSTEPDSTEPDSTEPDSTEPDSTEPDSTEPDSTEPDTTEPDTTEPDTTEPNQDPGLVDKVVVVGDSVNYFFSHDETVLLPEELLVSAKLIVDETEYDVMSQISFGLDANGPVENLTPAMVFEEMGAAYVASPVYVYYTPVGSEPVLVKNADVKIFVGVKGDANLDSVANANDAAEVLVYAATKGANGSATLYSDEDVALETLAYFLADVDGESRDCGADGSDLNALDAAGILVFAANKGANPGRPVADLWKEVLYVDAE